MPTALHEETLKQRGEPQPKLVSSDDAVSGVVQLNPQDVFVLATIPLTGSYKIKLPPVAEAVENAEYNILFKRATGTYVDGEVTVIAYGDAMISFAETDGATANNDRLAIKNIRRRYWRLVEDVTT